MDIGQKIREVRKQKSLTQKELGERAGISQQQIAQYENGKLKPKIETISKIAEALEAPKNLFYDNLDSFEKGEIVKYDLIDIIKNLNLEIKSITDKGENIENALSEAVEKKKTYMRLYDQLNKKGQEKAVEQVELLTKIPEYRKETE